MIKQAVLFVASTGLLIYFIMPVDDENQSQQPVVENEVKPKPANKVDSTDSWDAGSGDSEGEEAFVFGEPVTYSDDEYLSGENTVGDQNSVSSTSNQQSASAEKPKFGSTPRNGGTPKSRPSVRTGKPRDLSPPGVRRQP
jgi:hypothetical protein